MTPSASLNVQASKKSFTPVKLHVLCRLKESQMQGLCVHNNLVQKGSIEKHNHTELINTAKQVLKYSQFPNKEGAQYLAEAVINTS